MDREWRGYIIGLLSELADDLEGYLLFPEDSKTLSEARDLIAKLKAERGEEK